jgi:hypothetical protein
MESEHLRQAERGDLRPQFNPSSPVTGQPAPPEVEPTKNILLDRLFELSRPIGDASQIDESQAACCPQLRLSDIGRFLYLLEALERLGGVALDETLLVILDQFQALEPSSYDELYLWSIVHLSRLAPRHARTFWPLVIELDLRYRAAPWRRPEGRAIVDLPYRLTELLFYYYALHARGKQGPRSPRWRDEGTYSAGWTLGAQLHGLRPSLDQRKRAFVTEVLEELWRWEKRIAFSDALGLVGGRARSRPDERCQASG